MAVKILAFADPRAEVTTITFLSSKLQLGRIDAATNRRYVGGSVGVFTIHFICVEHSLNNQNWRITTEGDAACRAWGILRIIRIIAIVAILGKPALGPRVNAFLAEDMPVAALHRLLKNVRTNRANETIVNIIYVLRPARVATMRTTENRHINNLRYK
jgi:hypothetical protein